VVRDILQHLVPLGWRVLPFQVHDHVDVIGGADSAHVANVGQGVRRQVLGKRELSVGTARHLQCLRVRTESKRLEQVFGLFDCGQIV
jgi:hypothetical protein